MQDTDPGGDGFAYERDRLASCGGPIPHSQLIRLASVSGRESFADVVGVSHCGD